jgi:hypothetical protein
MAMWTAWPRCEMYISQHPDLPRRAHVTTDTWQAVSHVDDPHPHGELQVANFFIFYFYFFSVTLAHLEIHKVILKPVVNSKGFFTFFTLF